MQNWTSSYLYLSLPFLPSLPLPAPNNENKAYFNSYVYNCIIIVFPPNKPNLLQALYSFLGFCDWRMDE